MARLKLSDVPQEHRDALARADRALTEAFDRSCAEWLKFISGPYRDHARADAKALDEAQQAYIGACRNMGLEVEAKPHEAWDFDSGAVDACRRSYSRFVVDFERACVDAALILRGRLASARGELTADVAMNFFDPHNPNSEKM